MYDVNKFITNQRLNTTDPEGHLPGLPLPQGTLSKSFGSVH